MSAGGRSPGGGRRAIDARVLVVGAGGLGSPVALALAGHGIGTIGIVDPDPLEGSNLNRQILHTVSDIGRPKVASAAACLRARVPAIAVESFEGRIGPGNALAWVRRFHVVVDGSDNFETKFLVNDACVLAGVPFVAGGVVRFEGQVLPVLPRVTACYRCLFPEPPPAGATPACRDAGILGAVAGVIGALQAAEAVKMATGVAAGAAAGAGAGTGAGTGAGGITIYDGLRGTFRRVEVPRQADCPCCGASPTIRDLDPDRYGSAACEMPR